MKLYKIKAPNGQISKKSYSRGLAFLTAKELSHTHGQEYKPFVFISDAINHDHELSKEDGRYYTITHYETITP
jgi:hypothetical protein